MTRIAFTLLLGLATTAFAPAGQKTDPAPAPGDAGANVYRQVVRSTAWVHSDRGGGRAATGSGSLVDKGRRLVLTNYHVVGDVKRATVYFPEFGTNKKVIPEREYYTERRNRIGIPGEVVEIDKEGDLALIRIDRVPDGVPELLLTADSPDPGQTVHSIGNPGKSGALWVYTPGKVRQVYTKKWKAKLDERTVLEFRAKVIETDSPTNPGDSGGPLVNDKGELVGVTQGGALDADSLSLFVDLSEVKRLMNRRSVQALRSTDGTAGTSRPKDPPKPHREAALKSKDDAKFFSEDAWKKVAPAAGRLLKERGLDLVIETFATPPKLDPDKLKALTPAERERVFREFARERVKDDNIVGLYVVINKSPGFLGVERPESVSDRITDETFAKVKQALLGAFKQQKYDAGLEEALKTLMASQKLGEPKDAKKEGKP